MPQSFFMTINDAIRVDATTLIGVATAVGATLIGAIKYLFSSFCKMTEKTEARLEENLKDCVERDRITTEKVAELQGHVLKMSGHVEGYKMCREDIEKLHQDVLNTVREANENSD